MTELVDRLAELTGQRDRDVLDATLVEAFRDILVDIESASIYRRVGEAGHERWLTRARLVGRAAAAQAEPAWCELEGLPLLARLMRGGLRFHDRIYRFGGEEFVVLLRCRDDDSAALAFERLRGNTERYAFPQAGRITVSIGFAEVKAGDTPGAAFERADKAVYYAKSHGRNQAQSHALLVARGELEDAPRVGDIELF